MPTAQTPGGSIVAAPACLEHSLDVTDLRASELQREVLELRRRVKKLTALLRPALLLLRSSGFTLMHERLPNGCAKNRILRAVDRARAYVPLRRLLRFLRLSPSRFHAWRRLRRACALDDQLSCPRTSPYRLTPPEVRTIEDMVTSPAYRHVPTGTLAVLAQRLGKVWASPSTWYRLVRQNGWRRPRLRVHPAKPKVGLRTTRADEVWHIDTTVIRLLDGTRAYLHAVIDNFSRRILAWRVADTFAPVNSVAVLVEASRGATPSETTPVVLADAGVENVNAQVDDLITTGVLRRVLAFTELKFSNSMIEAWWRSLKHQRYAVLFVLDLATRRVQIAGIASEPDSAVQCGRQLTDAVDGFLAGKRFLLHDRDPLFSEAFRETLAATGVETVRLPPRSPNLNAFAERFVRSIKESCLNRLILVGEDSLRRAVREFVAHYHLENGTIKAWATS